MHVVTEDAQCLAVAVMCIIWHMLGIFGNRFMLQYMVAMFIQPGSPLVGRVHHLWLIAGSVTQHVRQIIVTHAVGIVHGSVQRRPPRPWACVFHPWGTQHATAI